MSEPRNAYGFPLISGDELLALLNSRAGAALIGWHAPTLSKLERAQAIAAEVRARRFPPVQRITNPKD